MPFRISLLLKELGDGKWHNLDQLKQLLDLSDFEIKEVTRFLSQYDLAEFDKDPSRVRINKDFKKILAMA
jgi:hypothetical protein